ncbi:MAG: SGNH/GDSL hydrolase family protein [Tannerella sp.]|jgi:lysophospholipase L1-like esterase|nr:SGNH/GDSL hydrolase family protein [Tannerella sp.]
MKRFPFIAIVLFFPFAAKAQTVFHDASTFPLLGKISDKTETRYERLPVNLKNTVRPPVWELGKNTAGLALRFCSDSRTIAVRWETLNDLSMNHMVPTGIKGLDLYCLEDGKWIFINSARPTAQKSEVTVISDMERKERELMLYFPLYDGIVSLEIGVDSGTFIGQPGIELPQRTKPIVAYGTSILQGGCASRPGMAHTNILSRMLNREIINLGFSGNGQLDYEIAGLMAECDASLYILDFVPNASVQQIHEKMEKFYRILREKHPDVPIIFIEDPIFPLAKYDLNMRSEVSEKNKALHQVFENLKAKEEQNIRLIPSAGMIGNDNEATVDGIHFTDLGFMRYAQYLYPVIKDILPACENSN